MRVRLENSGYEITLSHPIGSGGMGTAYLHETNDGMIGKEMFDEFPEAKIRHLISRPLVPSHSGYSFAWPVDIGIDTSTGEAVMYFMPKAEDALDFTSLLAAADWLPKRFKYRVLLNTVRALGDLEQARYHRGDMPNSMVRRDAWVTEIDLDSLQVSHPGNEFLCGVAKLDWLAPELVAPFFANELSKIPTTAAHDAWSIAVSIWMLLRGDHPFDCRYMGAGARPKRPERIERGYWAYSTAHPDFQPRRGSPPLAAMHSKLAFLFRQTFETGHSKPSARPALAAWEAALARLDNPGDVALDREQWRCVEFGSRPGLCRRLAKPNAKKQGLAAASIALVSGSIFFASQNPGQTLVPPARESEITTSLSQPIDHLSQEKLLPTRPLKNIEPIQLDQLPRRKATEIPTLWSHVQEQLP